MSTIRPDETADELWNICGGGDPSTGEWGAMYSVVYKLLCGLTEVRYAKVAKAVRKNSFSVCLRHLRKVAPELGIVAMKIRLTTVQMPEKRPPNM